MKFTYETRRTCPACKREVDAVRGAELDGLRLSRHLRGEGFCPGSLGEVERGAK